MLELFLSCVLVGQWDSLLEQVEKVETDSKYLPTIEQATADPRSYKYDSFNFRSVAEDDFGKLWAIGYNIAGRGNDRTGSPNNEHPWLHNGGTDNVKGLTVRRVLWIPPGEKIRLRTRRHRVRSIGLPYARTWGDYPDRTLSVEYLLDDKGKLFEIRSRRRVQGKWEAEQIEVGEPPKGYVSVDSCTDCHSDIGKHARQLDRRREWYTTVRGLEVGGPIAFHPWEWKRVYRGFGISHNKVVRNDVKHLVEWVK